MSLLPIYTVKEETVTRLEKAKKIVDNLNDRAGVYIDFDDDIMEEIYEEIAEIIGA
jgi:type III secretion system FlhB-like substrate exporter